MPAGSTTAISALAAVSLGLSGHPVPAPAVEPPPEAASDAANEAASCRSNGADWHCQNVALDLHPVRENFLSDWQHETSRLMSGPTGLPTFRDPVNRMNVHWRLVDAGYEDPWMTAEEQDQVRQVAFAGATLGFQRAFNSLIERSPELAVVNRVARTATDASFEVRRSGDDMRVQVNTLHDRPQDALAVIDQPELLGPRRAARQRDPGLRVGAGIRWVDDGSTVDGGDVTLSLTPAAGSFVQLTRIGIDSLRIDAEVLRTDGRWSEGRWTIAGREQVWPGVFLVADVRGDMMTGLPTSLAAGPTWQLPFTRGWTTSTRVVEQLDSELKAEELSVFVGVRRQFGWTVPNDAVADVLGQRPDRSGPAPIELRATGPNAVGPLVQAPVEHVGDTVVVKR